MISPCALVLFGLLHAGLPDVTASAGSGPAVVLVALPRNADSAIREALNRLRGEAMSVGFEVRLVDAGAVPLSSDQLDSGLIESRAAAVVTVVRPDASEQGAGALEVTFLDRSTGKTSVAHVNAGDVGDAQGRADVIVAVRAVDFIRARMFDALAGRRVEPPPSPPPPPAPAPPAPARFSVSAGLTLLGTPSGFAPAVSPRLAASYAPIRWLHLGLSAFGLGSRPGRQTDAGRVDLDQGYVGLGVGLWSPTWHRLRLSAELGGGEYWVTVHGDPTPPYLGRDVTLTSIAASTAVGLALSVTPWLSFELRGGTLWLFSEAHIAGTDDAPLGTTGRPLWFGDVSLAVGF